MGILKDIFAARVKTCRPKIRRALFFIRCYFFPRGCALCEVALVGIDENWYGLCEKCQASLEGEPQEVCEKCSRPLIAEHGECLECRGRESPACDKTKVFFPYSGKNMRLLAAYKFGGNVALGNYFADKIIRHLASSGDDPQLTIVPVPPRPGKIKEKGWDQVEFLARLLEREREAVPGGIKICRCLKRLRSLEQKELDRKERLENLKNRIVLKKDAPQSALIIDDVITTGATLDACAAIMKNNGVKKVQGLCLFYSR